MQVFFRPWWLLGLVLAASAPAQSQGALFGGALFPGAENDDPSPLSHALAGFVESGNTWKPLAESLLAKGAQVDAHDKHGQTPLIRVIESGVTSQRQKIEWLLSKGADVTLRNRRGVSALEAALAAPSGTSAIVTLILEKSDVNAPDGNGATALFAAVKRGEARFVEQVLDKGADVNAQNLTGDTVLHLAAQKPGPMLQLLLSRGAHANLKNNRGDLPLHLALRSGRNQASITSLETLYVTAPLPAEKVVTSDALPPGSFIAPLIAQSDVNLRDASGLSPLLLAILARDQPLRDLLIARQPRLDDTTRLFDAASQGDLVTARNLLNRKPYLASFRLVDGTTPLHVSALWGTLQVAQLLVQKGAAVNARDSRAQVPLHLVLMRPDGIFARRAKNMLAWLLSQGADTNALGPNDASPLHLAARSGDAELILLLLSRHPNVNARDAAGQTPLFALMTKTSDLKVVRALIERGAELNVRPLTGSTVLFYATRTRRLDLVQLLLDQGADVGQSDFRGSTALAVFLGPSLGWPGSAAETRGLIPMTTLLLSKGADPNAPFNSDTLLSRAIEIDAIEIVRVFLATKRVKLSRSQWSESPLWTAVKYQRAAIVSLLLEAGADPTEKNWQGETMQQAADARGKEFGDFFKSKVALVKFVPRQSNP